MKSNFWKDILVIAGTVWGMATTFAYSLGFSESGSIIGFIVALALTILTT